MEGVPSEARERAVLRFILELNIEEPLTALTGLSDPIAAFEDQAPS